jgi:L-rhamnose mutarotase
MKRYCLTLNLQDDQQKIQEYEEYHNNVWPEIIASIREAGIINLEIYRWQTRLFMIVETIDAFTFEKKKILDSTNAKVQEWEHLMWNYQQALPGALPGEKWLLMDKIFQLD